jgi:beta-glucanase (GH16 family)
LSRGTLIRIAAIVLAVVLLPLIALQVVNARGETASGFSDDFDGAAGASPDPANWNFDVGGGGWGNGEAQTYTRSTDNARLDGNGHLVVEARRDGDGITSARLTTKDRFSFVHGRAEARIRLPRGTGLHPAFWLVGTDLDQVGWPQSGEIDVVESIGGAEFLYAGAIGPDTDGQAYKLAGSRTISPSFVDDFHTYWVQRDPGVISIGVDGQTTSVFRAADLAPDQQWVFDKPFFLLLNVAVGGDWPGPADQTTPFPADMLVDWVRVTRD